MDTTLSISTKSKVLLHAAGVKADGTPGSFAGPLTFTVESGSATLTDGPDANSREVIADDAGGSSTILVSGNADLQGGTRIVEARLFLITVVPVPAGPPANEVVSITLSVDAEQPK